MRPEDPLSGVTVVAVIGALEAPGGAEKAFSAIVRGFRDRLGLTVRVASHLPPGHAAGAGGGAPGSRGAMARSQPGAAGSAAGGPESEPVEPVVLRPGGAPPGPGLLLRARRLVATAPRPALLFPFQVNSNVLMGTANRLLPPSQRLPLVVNDRAYIDSLTSPLRARNAAGRLRLRLLRRAARYVYRSADAVVCNSVAGAEAVRRFLGGDPVRVETIYNPLEAEAIGARFPVRDREQWIRPGAPLLTAHGRLDAQKGFDVLIRALARIRRHPVGAGARLRIVGEGSARGELEALVRELGLGDAVELPGHTPDPLPAVEEGDLYVLPSRFEGLPNALLEAVAAGLPCVAADCPTGPAEILGRGGEAGVLVPVDDDEALAQAALALLADGPRRAALARAARARARDFAPERTADAYAALFREILAGRARRGAGS